MSTCLRASGFATGEWTGRLKPAALEKDVGFLSCCAHAVPIQHSLLVGNELPVVTDRAELDGPSTISGDAASGADSRTRCQGFRKRYKAQPRQLRPQRR